MKNCSMGKDILVTPIINDLIQSMVTNGEYNKKWSKLKPQLKLLKEYFETRLKLMVKWILNKNFDFSNLNYGN